MTKIRIIGVNQIGGQLENKMIDLNPIFQYLLNVIELNTLIKTQTLSK